MLSMEDYIVNELKKREKEYKASPAYIIEHYNIEQDNIQSYNGRQLLEMLQNANDAAETAELKKVLIRLTDKNLIISNNGEPFNEAGFESIIYSHISQKALQKNKIGYKGLGFRSILSWADEAFISSNNITVGFSINIAHDFINSLIRSEPSIGEYLRRKSKQEYPIAVLRIPKLLNDENYTNISYSTTIHLKLKDALINNIPIDQDVQNQINSLNKETLLFLNHLEIIEIESPGRRTTFKKVTDGQTIRIECLDFISGSNESRTWTLKTEKGEYDGKNYELSIAWNENLNDEENIIYSYFKTRVKFPFPGLVNGTFVLTSDRNYLENDTTGYNRFLFERLASLL